MNQTLNYITSIQFLSKYMKKYRQNFMMFYFGWFLDMLLSIAVPILLGIMIDEIIYYQNIDTFLKISFVFVMVLIYSCMLYFLIYAQHHYLMSMYTLDIKKDIFDHMQLCDTQYMTDAQTGDIVNLIQGYSGECMHFVIRNIIHFINGIIHSLVILCYLFVISWEIGVLILLAAPASVFINYKFGKKTQEYGKKEGESYSNYISWIFEMLSGIREIRMLGAKSKTDLKFEQKNKEVFDIRVHSNIASFTADNIVRFINLLIQLSIFVFAGYLAMSDRITIGLLTIVVGFYGQLTERIRITSMNYLERQNRISYIQRIYDFLNSPTEKSWNGKNTLNITKGEIYFEHINFAYKDSHKVFHDLNLHIDSGECFALVGQSGCGKTTLAYMLLGFYTPLEGEIVIDGQRLSECSLKSIRENIGLIAQDVLLFDGTIQENICMGNKKATQNEIIEACKQSGLWNFIKTLPDGMDTVIGTDGINLSGGQKQRIGIARIYLKNPKIIIFDEATSSLDEETEREVQESWGKVLAGRTSIVIAHRQNSIMMCSKAAIIEDGKIAEIGRPQDMVQRSIRFKRLFAIKDKEVLYDSYGNISF